MIDYGIVYSTVEPEEISIKETMVFIAKDILTEEVERDDTTEFEYKYHLYGYSKDEYIGLLSERNAELEDEVTSTELALCEVYEMIGDLL